MRSKGVQAFLISFFFVFIAQNSTAEGVTGKHNLTIIYTNDVQGEIEPCG
jgi:hypothetical protein